MTDPELSRARFADLAEAYGGDLRRWPAAAQPAARRFLSRHPEAAALLAEAGRLDALLGGWRVAGPGAALAEAVIASAPARPGPVRLRRWWIGLGLAGAALAGSVSGAAAIAMAPPPPLERDAAQPAEATALFADPGEDDS